MRKEVRLALIQSSISSHLLLHTAALMPMQPNPGVWMMCVGQHDGVVGLMVSDSEAMIMSVHASGLVRQLRNLWPRAHKNYHASARGGRACNFLKS